MQEFRDPGISKWTALPNCFGNHILIIYFYMITCPEWPEGLLVQPWVGDGAWHEGAEGRDTGNFRPEVGREGQGWMHDLNK